MIIAAEEPKIVFVGHFLIFLTKSIIFFNIVLYINGKILLDCKRI